MREPVEETSERYRVVIAGSALTADAAFALGCLRRGQER
jgi:hypothetical protein